MRHADTLEQKVKDFMDKHRMLSPGDRVVAGVSGGADSVCLLFVLLRWMKEISFTLHVVHVNHGIRKEAGEDAAYVEQLCSTYGIPFTLVEEDVRQRALDERRSEEEMGRLVRYEAFEKVLQQTGANKVAVAHNSNDRAETMLFHLFRGSGLSGLCGIRPVRDRIIRPILCLERREIEQYLEEKEIPYCQDVTNEKDDYTRNRIRHHILPYAEKEIVQGCVGHMSQTAAMLLETEDLLERLTTQAWETSVVEVPDSSGFKINCADYRRLDPVIGRRLIYRLLGRMSPGGKDIAYVHVQDVEALFLREGNRSISLPYGIRATRQYGEVRLERAGRLCEKGLSIMWQQSVSPEELLHGKVEIWAQGAGTLCFQVLSEKKCQDIPQNRYTKWFDYDKMKEPLIVRTRNTGDFLSIRGQDGQEIHKSVKDYMVTEKIPRKDRDRIPLIAAGNHVIWLVGYRISEYYKISKNTKRILQVQLRRDCESSEMEEDNGRTC